MFTEARGEPPQPNDWSLWYPYYAQNVWVDGSGAGSGPGPGRQRADAERQRLGRRSDQLRPDHRSRAQRRGHPPGGLVVGGMGLAR